MTLRRTSLLYVFLPYFLFWAGWLHLGYALPFMAVLGAALFLSFREDKPERRRRKADPRQLIFLAFCLLTVVVWTRFSGLGGYGYQNDDYVKHNAILRELVVRPWPVYVDRVFSSVNGDPLPLVYYIAHYLPAAAVGKLFGWTAANHFQFLWGGIGVFLVLAWFQRLTRPASFLMPVLFLFFSGLDIVGYLLLRTEGGTAHLEWWAEIVQYSSNTTLLFWVPQHVLGGWLLTALILTAGAGEIFLLGAGAALWSPFVTLGLAPFVATAAWRNRWRPLLTYRNLVAGPLVLVTTMLYLLANKQAVPMGWISQLRDVDGWAWRLLLFYVLEFGVFAALVFVLLKTSKETWRTQWWAATAALLACPLYVIGMNHDLGMRASIPALFVLAVLVGKSLLETSGPRWARYALGTTLVLGSVTSLAELQRAVTFDAARILPLEQTRSLASMGEQAIADAVQYFGDPTSFFFKRLAK